MGFDIGNIAGDNLPAFFMALAFAFIIMGIGAWAIVELNSNSGGTGESFWDRTSGFIYPKTSTDSILTENSIVLNNDGNFGYLGFNDITDDRYYELPNKNGTLATLDDIIDANSTQIYTLSEMDLESNIISNGSFEDWVDINTPVDWNQFAGGEGAFVSRESDIVFTGTYSAKLSVSDDGRAPMVIFQTISGLNPGDEYMLVISGYAEDIDEIEVSLLDDDNFYDSNTHQFDFESFSWTDVNWEDGLSDVTVADTNSWETIQVLFIVPDNGVVGVVIVADGNGIPYGSGYVDGIYMYPYERTITNITEQQIFYEHIIKDIYLGNYGKTDLVSVPNNYNFITVGSYIELQKFSTISSQGSLSVGKNDDCNNMILEFYNMPTEYSVITQLEDTNTGDEISYSLNPNETICLSVNEPWDGNLPYAIVHIIGMYVRPYNYIIGGGYDGPSMEG